ncbi:MAG: RimK/LysX family protein [Planctomycetota bacterium]
MPQEPALDSRQPHSRHRTIGYQEYVDLPSWGVRRLLAKADTGARSSALDAKDITELPGDRIRFDLVLSRRDRENIVTVEAPIVRHTRVKSSHGHTTERYVVAVELHVGDEAKTIEATLVSRKTMICRMLLGRTALGTTFLVDSSRRFVLSKPPKPRGHGRKPKPSLRRRS